MATILVDDVATEIGDKPITLLCHKGDVRLDPDGQVEIGAEQTLAREARITPAEWALLRNMPIFQRLFGIMFPAMDLAKVRLHQEGMGGRHVTGMILMLLELEPAGSRTCAFPNRSCIRAQSRLGDLIIAICGAGKAPG